MNRDDIRAIPVLSVGTCHLDSVWLKMIVIVLAMCGAMNLTSVGERFHDPCFYWLSEIGGA